MMVFHAEQDVTEALKVEGVVDFVTAADRGWGTLAVRLFCDVSCNVQAQINGGYCGCKNLGII